MKFDQYIGIGILTGQEVANMLLVQTHLEIPNHPSGKLQLWVLVSSSELTLSGHYMTLTLKNLWFYSLVWLEFFHQDLYRQISSLRNVFFSSQMLMLNLSFPHRFDGKHRCVTALLVNNDHVEIFCQIECFICQSLEIKASISINKKICTILFNYGGKIFKIWAWNTQVILVVGEDDEWMNVWEWPFYVLKLSETKQLVLWLISL